MYFVRQFGILKIAYGHLPWIRKLQDPPSKTNKINGVVKFKKL